MRKKFVFTFSFPIFSSFFQEYTLKAQEKHIEIARQILQFIDRHDHFMLSGHINADGDAIAAALAMQMFLQKLGKTAHAVFSDKKLDNRFNYLKNFERIINYDPQNGFPQNIESAIILDVPGYKRLGDVAKLLPAKKNVVKIDHHPCEDVMGEIDWVDEQASSTTSMIYEILDQAGIEIDIELAKAVYTGIVYDTGRFSFSNTTARDYYIAARMVEIGVKPSEITNRIFFENSFTALKTIGKGLASLENYLNGAVNVIYLDAEDMSKNDQSEIEELANYSVAIRGGEVGLFIREIKPDFHKVSFRSRGKVDVNVVAKAFDGGGHARAAGCRINGSKKEILPRILEEIRKQLEK